MLKQPRRWRMLIPLATLLGGLTASVLVAVSLLNLVDTRDRLSFERRVDQAQDAIRDRLDTYVTLLRAGVGLFNANHLDIDREAFQAFAAGLRLKKDYPGIQGIGYTARVKPDEREPFVLAQRQQGSPSFRIWPDHPRPESHSIIYLEPQERRNAAAIGYDMFSEPIRRAAMEQARDTGQPAASGKVELVQEIDETKQAGFLIYVPVYRGGATPLTTPERQDGLAGFVYSPFRADDLFTAVFQGGRNPGLELRVYDGPPSSQNLLHRSGPLPDGSGERAARYTDTRTLDVAGRRWTIAYLSSPQLEQRSTRSLVPLFFGGGLIATFLVSGVLWAQIKARSAADEKSREAQHELEERHRAEEGLRESEERLRLALEAGRLGTWELDLGTKRRLLSPRSAEIFGVPADELLDLSTWQAVIHPDDRGRVTSAFQEALEGRVLYRAEFRVLAKDERERWVSSQAVVHRDRSGAPERVVGIHQDVTERKRWEEHQVLLVNELNHRVKNTLATVQSIATQTLRNAPTTKEAKNALEGRLLALSRAHDVLTRENWEGAELREIAAQALEPYSSRGEDRLHLKGPKVRLPPRMALALAMVLQELATNAVKYGALSNSTGEIRITWKGDGKPPARLHLQWEESGGPPVQAPTRRGFGTRLIERSLAQELDGEVRIEFAATGVTCTVNAPIA
ncbi:CHASE domain-containing protein [Microvirga sp. GCM10011540]|uniref:CHASE domain-containing protein n=1 Tax=Microvirga sp. GCM10011540 TaxID=3317338 RepID=UPI0036175C63